MKRIGIDGHVLTGKYQGSRTWLLEILRRAPEMSPEMTYVVYSDDPDACRALVDAPNIEHRRIPLHSSLLRILFWWPWAIIAHGLDFLVTQYMSPLLFPQEQIVVVHDILFQTHPHFFPPKVRWRNRILVWLSAIRASKVITVSDFSRSAIAKAYRISEDGIAVVRNGFSPRSGSSGPLPPQLSPATPYLLCVGRLEPRKNIRLALSAFETVADPAARLVIVGRDDFETAETLARLRSNPRVVHLADVTDETLAALYSNAKAFVYPSEGEGWGIPVQEALGYGCPVIASSATAIPEAGGPACHYFDPAAPGAAAALGTLMGEALGGTLPFDAKAAAAHIAAHSWDTPAHEFVTALRSLVDYAAHNDREFLSIPGFGGEKGMGSL